MGSAVLQYLSYICKKQSGTGQHRIYREVRTSAMPSPLLAVCLHSDAEFFVLHLECMLRLGQAAVCDSICTQAIICMVCNVANLAAGSRVSEEA